MQFDKHGNALMEYHDLLNDPNWTPISRIMRTPHGREDLYKRKWMHGGRLLHDEADIPRLKWATCNHCERSWNEAYITGRTPAPSARCPFEDEHHYPDEV